MGNGDKNQKHSAEHAAARLLAVRQRASAELADRLERKNFSAGEIEKVINRYTELGILDDRKFVIAAVNDLLQGKPAGKILVRQKLKKYHLEPSLVEEVLSGLLPAEKEKELALRALKKKKEVLEGRGLTREKIHQSTARYLQSRGFSSSLRAEVMEEAFHET